MCLVELAREDLFVVLEFLLDGAALTRAGERLCTAINFFGENEKLIAGVFKNERRGIAARMAPT